MFRHLGAFAAPLILVSALPGCSNDAADDAFSRLTRVSKFTLGMSIKTKKAQSVFMEFPIDTLGACFRYEHAPKSCAQRWSDQWLASQQ